MTTRLLVAVYVAVLAAALGSVGCGDDATATSPTSTSPTSPVTETFSGQFVPGGSASRSFTSASSGTVSLTLAQIGPPADLVVGFGVGIPPANGSGCYLAQSVETGASSSPQLTVPVDAGSYCVRLYDTGTMTAQVAFMVTIVRP